MGLADGVFEAGVTAALVVVTAIVVCLALLGGAAAEEPGARRPDWGTAKVGLWGGGGGRGGEHEEDYVLRTRKPRQRLTGLKELALEILTRHRKALNIQDSLCPATPTHPTTTTP